MMHLKAMREGTRRRVRQFVALVCAGIGAGAVYGGLIGIAGWGQALFGAAIGAVHGLVILSAIGFCELFAVRTPIGRRIEQAPLVLTILTKGIIYGAVIAAVELGNIGEWVVLGEVNDPVTTGAFRPMSIAFSFIITFILIFFLQISRLIGGQTLKNLMLGRYHRPRTEDRFFLFVDLVGSTRMAEQIGPLAMHRLLNRVFALVAEPVADRHGEIYQYVGDEIVITWPVATGRLAARPLACFFAIQSALAEAAPGFTAQFGITPTVRGALHAGTVVAGEVGIHRRSIVYHGDVMNVCARLEQATREMGCSFLASDTAIELFDIPNHLSIRDHGPLALRGRQSPMHVFEVSCIE